MGKEYLARGVPETRDVPWTGGNGLHTQPLRGSGFGVSRVGSCNPPPNPGFVFSAPKRGAG